jgi:hypothetical protein
MMSTENLLSLKDDMVAFIEGHGLRRLPAFVSEDIPAILWESHGNPEAWKDFSEISLDGTLLDDLIEEASEIDLPDEETSALAEIRWLRSFAGRLGYIQLGFVYQGIAFLHESTTEWYERYQALVESLHSLEEIMDDDSSPDDEDE